MFLFCTFVFASYYLCFEQLGFFKLNLHHAIATGLVYLFLLSPPLLLRIESFTVFMTGTSKF